MPCTQCPCCCDCEEGDPDCEFQQAEKRMSTEVTTTLETSLQLSLIYKRLLNSLKQCRRRDEQVAAMALVNEAFNEAVRYLSARCPKCDADDTSLICRECWKTTPLKQGDIPNA